jgi:hypothetical protein
MRECLSTESPPILWYFRKSKMRRGCGFWQEQSTSLLASNDTIFVLYPSFLSFFLLLCFAYLSSVLLAVYRAQLAGVV